MKVFVALNVNRDHELEFVGVAESQAVALSLLEKRRSEPLRIDETDGFSALNFAAGGHPDCVGYCREVEVITATMNALAGALVSLLKAEKRGIQDVPSDVAHAVKESSMALSEAGFVFW